MSEDVVIPLVEVRPAMYPAPSRPGIAAAIMQNNRSRPVSGNRFATAQPDRM